MTGLQREEELLHAYYDGELSGFARWRFERKLSSSAALRQELENLKSIGGWVRAADADVAAPDLWDKIALHLPAEEARRAERQETASASFWPGLVKPFGALAAAGAAAAVLAFGLMPGDTETMGAATTVHWMDSGERNVMVFQGDEETTFIWVLDSSESV